MLDRLLDEQGAADVSYSTVRDYVARRRPEIAAEAGRSLAQGFVPQAQEPGGEAEVDFADLWVVLRGVKTKTFMFTLRLSYSGKAVRARPGVPDGLCRNRDRMLRRVPRKGADHDHDRAVLIVAGG